MVIEFPGVVALKLLVQSPSQARQHQLHELSVHRWPFWPGANPCEPGRGIRVSAAWAAFG
jgi:hypothetical protein